MTRIQTLAPPARNFAWKRRVVTGALLLAMSPAVHAGLDHPVTPNNSGIWSHQYTQALEIGVIATEAASLTIALSAYLRA